MKKFLLMLAMMLPCLGAWAEIEVSNSVETPENTYSLLSKNGAYMSTGTGSTQYNLGRFAFYAEGENSYKIYSVDSKKWVSYNKADSYSDGANKATLVDNKEGAQAWNVVANGDYYNLEPYKNDGTVAGTYWNFHGGAGASNKTYIYDDEKTVGFYNQKGDGGSLWTLEKLTLATEEEVNAAKALVAVGPGYPKTTTSVYKAMNALTVGKSTTKHIDLAKPAYQTTTDIQLPENGKAYTFTALFKNNNKLYMKYENGKKVSVSTESEDASVFVCKELRAGVYAFITVDGHLLTWVGNDEGSAYKEEGFNAPNGYSNYFATTYNSKSDWNEITVKKNDANAEQLGLLRLVARRHSTGTSSFIANKNVRFDQASDGNWFNNDNTSGWIVTEVAHTNTDAQNVAIAKIDVKTAGYEFGTNVGTYYYMNGETKVSDKASAFATLDTKTSINDVDAFKNSFTLNMPVAGKFYRIKGISGNYIDATSIYNKSNATTGQMSMKSSSDCNLAGTIFYLDNQNQFLNYATGRYVLQTSEIGAVGATPGVWAFAESTRTIGKYTLSQTSTTSNAGKHLHDNAGNRADRCSSICGNRHDFTIEEVTSLPVTITEAGYATFYAPVAVQVEGITANTVTVNGEWATLNAIEGGVVPANKGVILSGDEGTYNLAITETETTMDSGLEGTVASSYITKEAYALGYINVAEEGQPENMQVGFYTAEMTNNQWLNNGFKAYLPKTTTAQVLRFNFGGNTTAIESVVAPSFDANAPIYDLSGRRVVNAVKGGLYIQNGKKFIVR